MSGSYWGARGTCKGEIGTTLQYYYPGQFLVRRNGILALNSNAVLIRPSRHPFHRHDVAIWPWQASHRPRSGPVIMLDGSHANFTNLDEVPPKFRYSASSTNIDQHGKLIEA